jgi:NAD(P)-dependent dehydrogenase (short-subunit alcohol dehydrogenase family)
VRVDDRKGETMSTIDFSGRVAIVTGAGAGLGKDYALHLAARGAKVVVNDLGGSTDGVGSDSAAADQVVEEIRAAGGEAVASYDTVATVEGGENIVKTALDAWGKVDILINNAGILRDKTFVKMEEENWDAVMDVHLKGAYCVTRPAFTNMKANGYGRIVMTGSVAGVIGNFGQANYAAAKFGIAGLTNVLKLEGAKYDIKVNVILPGAITRLSGPTMPAEVFEGWTIEKVTPVVLYMCSEQCTDTGMYIHALAGYFSRSNIVTGPGAYFTDMPTAEGVADRWDEIISLEGAEYYNDMNEMFGKIMPKLRSTE